MKIYPRLSPINNHCPLKENAIAFILPYDTLTFPKFFLSFVLKNLILPSTNPPIKKFYFGWNASQNHSNVGN